MSEVAYKGKLLTQQKPASRNQCRYFTLRIRQSYLMYCKARSRNWQLQLIKPNRRYRPISVQLFDWQETSQLWLQTQCRRQKQSSKWPSPALTHRERWRRHWYTAAAWSNLAHSVLMRCLSSSRSVMHVLYTPHLAVHASHTVVNWI